MDEKLDKCFCFKEESARLILGENDKNLLYIESLLSSEVTVKGNTAKSSCQYFIPLMIALEKLSEERGALSEAEIFMEWENIAAGKEKERRKIKVGSQTVYAKSWAQNRLIETLASSDVIFALGPAGTGKTFLSVLFSLSLILSGEKKKMVISRPVVEAGESLGFLPGDVEQKIQPYLRPIYDSLSYAATTETIKRLEERDMIEILPLAYMRGRSLKDSVMILDEAQNATKEQLKMFLTRMSENSKAIITGDPTQSDIKDSALRETALLLSGIKGVEMVEFQSKDTIRNKIVRDIIAAFEREETCRK